MQKKVLTGRPASAVASLALMRDGDDEQEEREAARFRLECEQRLGRFNDVGI